MRAFEAGSRFAEIFSPAPAVASGIRVSAAVGDILILDAIRESGGTACAVDERRIVDWLKLAMTSAGVSVCAESAACVGAAIGLRETGWLSPTDRDVLYNCGAARKFVDIARPALPRAPSGDVNGEKQVCHAACETFLKRANDVLGGMKTAPDGWGSPIVVAGRVCLSTHRSKPRIGGALVRTNRPRPPSSQIESSPCLDGLIWHSLRRRTPPRLHANRSRSDFPWK